MKTDAYFLKFLARDIASNFRGAQVHEVLEEEYFIGIDTNKGSILVSLFQPSPLIGNVPLPTDKRNKRIEQMISNLYIDTVGASEYDRIIKIDLKDRLGIISREVVVELIPNYATMLILENGNVIYSSRKTGAGKREFSLGQKYSFPRRPAHSSPYHPQREEILERIPKSVKSVFDNYLNRTDFPFMIVARNLPWPSPTGDKTSMELASEEILDQLETYYQNKAKKAQEQESLKPRETTTSEEQLIEQIETTKRYGQALLAMPMDTSGTVRFTDWATGEDVTVDISKFRNTVEAAQYFFEKARRLERKLSAQRVGNIPPEHKRSREEFHQPYKRIFLNGIPIYIGLSASGNEFVTFTSAQEHWWFHVKEGSGAHVVVRTSEISQDIISVAAKIAAYHSSKREEKKVEVVYTQIKNISRHPRHKKGLVLYKNFNTVIAEPASEDTLSQVNE
jgi:predicted ribosome quality control (RQC) complex YloA/Tae2 family protein